MFENTVDTFPYIFPIPHVYSEMNVRVNGGKGAEVLKVSPSDKYKKLVNKFRKKYNLLKAEEMAARVLHNK